MHMESKYEFERSFHAYLFGFQVNPNPFFIGVLRFDKITTIAKIEVCSVREQLSETSAQTSQGKQNTQALKCKFFLWISPKND